MSNELTLPPDTDPEPPTVEEIAAAMKRMGGSFWKGMGEAVLHADPVNLGIIIATWPERWEHYKGMALAFRAKTTPPTPV